MKDKDVPYRRTVQVRKPELIELHDFLNQHVPIDPKHTNGCTFCRKCGSPIQLQYDENVWKSITDEEVLKNCILYSHRYNKFSVALLTQTALGAYFIALHLGITSSENKRKALTNPEMAYNWACVIDERPSKETWEAVRYHISYSEAYKRFFGLTDENIRENQWKKNLQLAEPDSLPQPAAQFKV